MTREHHSLWWPRRARRRRRLDIILWARYRGRHRDRDSCGQQSRCHGDFQARRHRSSRSQVLL